MGVYDGRFLHHLGRLNNSANSVYRLVLHLMRYTIMPDIYRDQKGHLNIICEPGAIAPTSGMEYELLSDLRDLLKTTYNLECGFFNNMTVNALGVRQLETSAWGIIVIFDGEINIGRRPLRLSDPDVTLNKIASMVLEELADPTQQINEIVTAVVR